MKIIDIASRSKKSAPMQCHKMVNVGLLSGIDGDANRRPGKRQVTLLSQIQWQQACQELDVTLPWTVRRSNILVDEVIFCAADVGKIVQIGELVLRICVEIDPCHKMDQQHQGLQDALRPDWRGGVGCKVIQPGQIKIGDICTISNDYAPV